MSVEHKKSYCHGMTASIDEKLFFLPHIGEFGLFVDFGCADGFVLEHITREYPDRQFIGWDGDATMRQLARERFSGYTNISIPETFEEVLTIISSYKSCNSKSRIALYGSSVHHELDSYGWQAWTTLSSVANILIVRDFSLSEVMYRDLGKNGRDELNRRRWFLPWDYSSFFSKFRKEYFSWSELKECSVKVLFPENFEEECKETYFQDYKITDYAASMDNYRIAYLNYTRNEFLNSHFRNLFKMDWLGHSHINLILEN